MKRTRSPRTLPWRTCIGPRPPRRAAPTNQRTTTRSVSESDRLLSQKQRVQVPVVLSQHIPRGGRRLWSLAQFRLGDRGRQRGRGRNGVGGVAIFAGGA